MFGEANQRAPLSMYVWIFNSNAPSYRALCNASCYCHHEQAKQNQSEEQVGEVASFTSLVFTNYGRATLFTAIFIN